MPTSRTLSVAEELYLVLHYDPVTGELLRNGKVNGSEAQVLSAAKLVDLIEGGRVAVERTRTMREAIVATEQVSDDAALDEARALLWRQSKDRSITWGLSNLGSSTLLVAGLVALGLVVEERKPLAPLTPLGAEVLRERREQLDAAWLGEPADERAQLVAVVLFAGKVWRNVYLVRDRSEKDSTVARLTVLTERAARVGERGKVIGRLLADAVTP
ncbi:hypothetical protein GCM10027413_11480 [Conyzicola nivalis]|uniref:Uncharacterized protein n=1 Tax=Conyzicola nivalis TaxID=1477021 RepID=A0A916SK58_9MICO|nr:GPP34 family phosphoprotein [Conyzicola nivalis]GGB01548.1 hypothetical protein GCM10010979_15150 [Conyzicola nivalis]